MPLRTVDAVTTQVQPHRWTTEGFLRAFEAGRFGYRTVRQHRPGEHVPVPCTDAALDVAALVGAGPAAAV